MPKLPGVNHLAAVRAPDEFRQLL